MDQDIAQAADTLALERIKAQEYRDSVRAVNAREDKRLTLLADQVSVAKTSSSVIQAEANMLLSQRTEVRLDIVKAIAANYMKPSTGTSQAAITADAELDAARLAAAVAEVEKVVWGAGGASPLPAPVPGTGT